MKTDTDSRRDFLIKSLLGIPSLFIVYPNGARVDSQPLHSESAIWKKYRDGIIDRIQLVREANAELFDTVAQIGAKSILTGKKCYAYMHAGHTHNADNFEGRIGLPKLFVPVEQTSDFSVIKPGDFLVCTSGDNPEIPDVIKERKVTVVSWTYPYGGDAHHLYEKIITSRAEILEKGRLSQYTDYIIDTFQEPEDGTIDIPGIRAKFGAQSGPLVMSIFWTITLKIVERLAKEGIELEVYG